jgi:hypothetical protein
MRSWTSLVIANCKFRVPPGLFGANDLTLPACDPTRHIQSALLRLVSSQGSALPASCPSRISWSLTGPCLVEPKISEIPRQIAGIIARFSPRFAMELLEGRACTPGAIPVSLTRPVVPSGRPNNQPPWRLLELHAARTSNRRIQHLLTSGKKRF